MPNLKPSVMDGVQFHQVLSTPRRTGTDQQRDVSLTAELFTALTAAHADLMSDDEPGVVVGAWERTKESSEVRVLLGGKPFFPAASNHVLGETAGICYPAGTAGLAIAADKVIAGWQKLSSWLRCSGQVDPLWNGGSPRLLNDRGCLEQAIAHLVDPFVWLIVAEPLPVELIDRELFVLDSQMAEYRQWDDEIGKAAVQRARNRYGVLRDARSSGIWNVHVLVGGQNARTVRRAAGLLCSARDLDNVPYDLIPGTQVTNFSDAWLPIEDTRRYTASSPLRATGDVVAALIRPPTYELPGINLVEQTDFDITPESSGPIQIGSVLDDCAQMVGNFSVDTDTLNRHTFITGATGSGKSQTVRYMLEQLHKSGIPWLAIEPAKAEYAGMAGRIGANNVTVLHPGQPDEIPYGLNPLEPEHGFPMQTHIDLIRALFMAAFDSGEPFPQVLGQALERCYRELGWEPAISSAYSSKTRPRYPTLGDLQRSASVVVDHVGYGSEVAKNVKGFIDIRLGSLRLGTTGRFFEGPYQLDMADLLSRNVVLEIENLGSDNDKAFFIGVILIRLYEYLWVQRSSADFTPGLKHVTVIEEAHRLLKRVSHHSNTAHAVELFTSLLAETRAYGEGIIVAEQIPSKIVPDVIKNTALKIIHRLPAQDDRDSVGATVNLTESQSRAIVALPPGRAAVFSSGMDRLIRVHVPLGENRESRDGVNRTLRTSRVHTATSGGRLLTVRELNQAAHLVDDPRMVLWIEFLLAAHVAGVRPPLPKAEGWFAELRKAWGDDLLLDGIRQRIEVSVNDRYASLAASYPPEDFASHLMECAYQYAVGKAEPCSGNEWWWQAGYWRWEDIFRALRDDSPERPEPHPDTHKWLERGLCLTGKTQKDQLEELRNHPARWSGSKEAMVGSGNPNAAEKAAKLLSNYNGAHNRMKEATQFLDFFDAYTRWFRNYMVVSTTLKKAAPQPNTDISVGEVIIR